MPIFATSNFLSMKNILLFIFLFSMALLGAKDTSGVLSEEGIGVESVLQADERGGSILPVLIEWPEESEAYVNAENMALQLRVCGRGQRQLSVHQLSFLKTSAYGVAKKRLESLLHSSKRTYTSLPCLSWPVASDHYVFGMRRILI